MTSADLARIQRVSLQEAWPHEAHNFTPWLAENLDELGDALGVALELQGQEVPVGAKFLDIFAIDGGDGCPVIIENQLYPTDDNHLGRLLIYAAGKDAKMVIWVAREILDEHRQVLDWLNQRTDGNTQFYGVAVELWKIDDSRPAPYFKVVATPNDWGKENVTRPPPDVTDRQRQNIKFRRQLAEKLKQKYVHSIVGPKLDSPTSYCFLESLTGEDHYSTDFTTKLRVNLWFYDSAKDPGRNQRVLELLKEHQETVESALCDPDIGEWFEWRTLASGSRSGASVFRGDDFYRNPDSWDEYHEWIIAKFFKFREVFTPLLAELAES